MAIASFVSDTLRVFQKDMENRGKAQVAGFREAARGLERDLEAATEAAGLGRLSRAWKSRVYPDRPGAGSLAASAIIYPVGGERTQKAFHSFTNGAVVSPGGAEYLTIPTNFNRLGGRRRSRGERMNVKGEVRLTPEEMIRSRMAFLIKRPAGGWLWMLKIAVAQKKLRGGRIRDMAFAGGLAQVGTSSLKMTRGVIKAGAVPMYVLLPGYDAPRRFSVAALEASWRRRVPDLVEQAYQSRGGR